MNAMFAVCMFVCLCMSVFFCVCVSVFFVSPWLRNLPVTALDTLYSVGVNFEIKEK